MLEKYKRILVRSLTSLLLLLTLASPSWATVAFVQAGTSSTASNTVVLGAITVTSGDLLVVTVGCSTCTGLGTATVASVPANTWTKAVTVGTTGNAGGEIWYAPNAASGSTVVTVTYTGAAFRSNVFEFSGVATSTPVDKTATDSSSNPAITGKTATTAQADECAVGFIRNTAGTMSAASGTVGTWTSSAAGGSEVDGWVVESSAGSVGGTNGNAAASSVGAIVTFKGTTPSNFGVANRSQATSTPGAVATVVVTNPAGNLSGDAMVMSIYSVDTSNRTITGVPSGWTQQCSTTSFVNNRHMYQLTKISNGSEPATVNVVFSGAIIRGFVVNDAFYDSGGGTLSFGSGTCITTFAQPPNTTHNWDAMYASTGSSDGGINNMSVKTPQWLQVDKTSDSNDFLISNISNVPTAGAVPTYTLINRSNDITSYIPIIGANAPTPDYRLRAVSADSQIGTSVNPSNPANSGDLMVAWVISDAQTVSSSGGWTLVDSDTGQKHLKVFKTTATGSDNMTFTTGSSDSISIVVAAFYANSGGSLTVAHHSVSSAAPALTVTGPNITPSTVNDLIVSAYLNNGSTTGLISNLSNFINMGTQNWAVYGNDVFGLYQAETTGTYTPPSASMNTGWNASTAWEMSTLDLSGPTATATATATPTTTATPTATATVTATPTFVPYRGRILGARSTPSSMTNWRLTSVK